MTKPTLLSGGCSQRRVDFQRLRFAVVHAATFLAFMVAVCSTRAADVSLYTVTKGTRHQQLTNAAPVFLPLDEYVFEAKVIGGTNLIRSAFVEATNNIDRVLVRATNFVNCPPPAHLEWDPTEFAFDADDNNAQDLNSKYPNGRFRFYIRTVNDGYRTNISMMLTGSYPTVPRILNYSELQAASGTGFVQVGWAPFVGGTAQDSIQLRIEDLQCGTNVFKTRDFGEIGALDGRATNYWIEPGHLEPNKSYLARLEFRRTSRVNTTSYPGATGWAYLHRRTEFRIHTGPDSGPLDLESYTISKGRNYVQTNTNPPILEGNGINGYVFSASMQSTITNGIVSNRFTAPNGNVTNVFPEDCRPETQLDFSYTVSSQTGLDNSFPDGTYQIDVTTTREGSHSMALSLSGADYPPVPTVLNFDPSIPVRSTNSIEIRWAPWAGGRSSDFIQLRLLKGCATIYETGDFGDNDALNGFATNAIIPADILPQGETVRATLTFRRFSDLDLASYPGAIGIASYFSRLKFDVSSLLDVQGIELAKGHNFVQTNTAGALPDGINAFEFFAEVDAQTAASISSAFLGLPGGTVFPLTNAFGDDKFAHAVVSSNALDMAYPPGPYNFNIQPVHDLPQNVTLTLSELDYPPAPHVLHDPVLRVPHDQTNRITWEPWVGGTTNDFIQLRIRDQGSTVWETPDFGETNALNGVATYADIPPDVLARGKSYSTRLIFRRYTNVQTTNDSEAVAYYFAQTKFDLKTIKPDLEEYSLEKGQNFVQTSTTNLVPEAGAEFIFGAQVQGSSTGLISSAKLIIPTGTTFTLTADPLFEQFELNPQPVAPTSALLDSGLPPGRYRFDVTNRNDGFQSVFLTLSNVVYPPAPHIVNFPFTDPFKPTNTTPISLVWDPWAGGTTNDFVQLQIRDSGTNVFETPDFGETNALNGLSTTADIPPGLLIPGKSYNGRIFFRRFLYTEDNNGSIGTISVFSRTRFAIVTLPPDAEAYSLFKGREYVQTNAAEPVPSLFVFNVLLTGQADGASICCVTITTPNNEVLDLAQQENAIDWLWQEGFTNQAELDVRYPDGPYVLSWLGFDYGATNVSLSLSNAAYPNAPHIINYTAAGRIVASSAFPLSWDPFTNGTLADYIGVILSSVAGGHGYISPPLHDPQALDGLDAGVVINGGTLDANSLYDGTIRFEKLQLDDETTFPEVQGRVGFYARTSFRALTEGPGNPPRIPLSGFQFLPGNTLEFVVTTVPGVTYLIEGSLDLVNWVEVVTVIADDVRYTHTMALPPGPNLFLRASFQR